MPSRLLKWDWAKKTVLITGANGFIGKNLTNRLRNAGANLMLISQSASINQAAIRSLRVEDDEFRLAIQAEGFDVIYHLGSSASKQAYVDDPINMMAKTLRGVSNIADYARAHKNTQIIFPSASLVYGNTVLPCSELQPPRPVHPYSVVKLAGERILMTATENLSILRISNGYGAGEANKSFPSPITQFAMSILNDKPVVIYGDGHQARDFVYVSDIIEVLVRTAETNQRGMFNVGTGETHGFLDVVERIVRLSGHSPQLQFVPKPDGYSDLTKIDTRRLKSWYTRRMVTIDEGIKLTLDSIAEGMV